MQMAKIFNIIAGVVALQLVLCLATKPRTISLQIVTLKGTRNLTADVLTVDPTVDPPNVTGESKTKANEKSANVDMSAFRKAEVNPKQELKDKNIIEGKYQESVDSVDSVEGLRDSLAEKLAEAGNVVFVSGRMESEGQNVVDAPNYIQVPAKLGGQFKVGMLIRYKFATLEIGEKNKPIEEAHVKIITKIDGGKLFYKSLEFTISDHTDLVFTLGPVHAGRFYMEPGKIKAYDEKHTGSELANKKLSSFKDWAHLDTKFVPKYKDITFSDADQKVLTNCVKGKISDLSVTFIVNKGKQKLSESLVTWEFMVHSDKTLNEFGDLLRNVLVDSSGENLKLGDLSVSYSFTFHYKNDE